MTEKETGNALWLRLQNEASDWQEQEPLLSGYLDVTILDHEKFSDALGFVLASKLAAPYLEATELRGLFAEVHRDASLARDALRDLTAVLERDPAAHYAAQVFLYFKGFQALQVHRMAHALWTQERWSLAYHLQSRAAQVLDVDIHPAAKLGHGIMLDHATGIVIGETAVVGNNVSMLHGVTLGGTGKECGDRHPKIGNGVLLGTGCRILGNIRLGDGVKVAAGSVVLEDVAAHTTVAGVPAKVIGKAKGVPAKEMNQKLKE